MKAVRESAPADTADLRMLTLHGDRVAYLDEGAGEVLLLIHGLGGSTDCWRGVVHKLATRYRVIAVDLLGHGQSDKPRGDYSLGAFAVWLRDFLDALDIREATVIGHSFGGGVALQFAHQHKEYCRRLVLISSGGLGPDLGPLLRIMSLPGAELVLPLIASPPAIGVGKALRKRALSSGREVTRYSETFKGLAALSNRAQPRRVPADIALGRRPPRPGGVRTESSAYGPADADHLRRPGPLHPRRARARGAQRDPGQRAPCHSRCRPSAPGAMPRRGGTPHQRLRRHASSGFAPIRCRGPPCDRSTTARSRRATRALQAVPA